LAVHDSDDSKSSFEDSAICSKKINESVLDIYARATEFKCTYCKMIISKNRESLSSRLITEVLFEVA
jgi:hypothetical protein